MRVIYQCITAAWISNKTGACLNAILEIRWMYAGIDNLERVRSETARILERLREWMRSKKLKPLYFISVIMLDGCHKYVTIIQFHLPYGYENAFSRWRSLQLRRLSALVAAEDVNNILEYDHHQDSGLSHIADYLQRYCNVISSDSDKTRIIDVRFSKQINPSSMANADINQDREEYCRETNDDATSSGQAPIFKQGDTSYYIKIAQGIILQDSDVNAPGFGLTDGFSQNRPSYQEGYSHKRVKGVNRKIRDAALSVANKYEITLDDDPCGDDIDFMTVKQFKTLYNAIAFANRTGRVINCHITINWGLFGLSNHKAAQEALETFINRYRSFHNHHKADKIAFPIWVYVHECSVESGMHTHLLMHVPDHLRANQFNKVQNNRYDKWQPVAGYKGAASYKFWKEYRETDEIYMDRNISIFQYWATASLLDIVRPKNAAPLSENVVANLVRGAQAAPETIKDIETQATQSKRKPVHFSIQRNIRDDHNTDRQWLWFRYVCKSINPEAILKDKDGRSVRLDSLIDFHLEPSQKVNCKSRIGFSNKLGQKAQKRLYEVYRPLFSEASFNYAYNTPDLTYSRIFNKYQSCIDKGLLDIKSLYGTDDLKDFEEDMRLITKLTILMGCQL